MPYFTYRLPVVYRIHGRSDHEGSLQWWALGSSHPPHTTLVLHNRVRKSSIRKWRITDWRYYEIKSNQTKKDNFDIPLILFKFFQIVRRSCSLCKDRSLKKCTTLRLLFIKYFGQLFMMLIISCYTDSHTPPLHLLTFDSTTFQSICLPPLGMIKLFDSGTYLRWHFLNYWKESMTRISLLN